MTTSRPLTPEQRFLAALVLIELDKVPESGSAVELEAAATRVVSLADRAARSYWEQTGVALRVPPGQEVTKTHLRQPQDAVRDKGRLRDAGSRLKEALGRKAADAKEVGECMLAVGYEAHLFATRAFWSECLAIDWRPPPGHPHHLCDWSCTCPGPPLSEVSGAVDIAECVIRFIDWLPAPSVGPASRHLRAAERIIEGCRAGLRGELPPGLRPTKHRDATVSRSILDLTWVDVERLQQPLRQARTRLARLLRNASTVDSRHATGELLQTHLAARAYGVKIEMLDALIGLDLTEPLE